MSKTEIMGLLDQLNGDYVKVHKRYINLFWRFNMGDRALERKFNQATKNLDAFRADNQRLEKVALALDSASGELKTRLEWWRKFFKIYQTPDNLVPLKNKIIDLESAVQKKLNSRKEGYIDPKTGKFVVASINKIGAMMGTEENEEIRKACFEAIEKLSVEFVDEYVEIVKLRNQFAQKLGYDDFYDYRLSMVEGMTKKDVFDIFDEIYKKTKYAFKDIRKMKKTMPGLRKPWNFEYVTSGDFTKEEDQYFQFNEALGRWGQSFAALGIDYNDGELQLDLLDRKGKFSNGFCDCQNVVYQKDGQMVRGKADFTCNVILGQVGSGVDGTHTLFHEGAHTADKLNSVQKDAILNTEDPPASESWAETHSQFCDTMMSSIDWKTRYTKYPFELFERKIKKLQPFLPLGMMEIIYVSEFEREIYETKDLTNKKTLEIAKKLHRKYYEQEVDRYYALQIPHIYCWPAYYHGYGLSQLAVHQWREYFYKKYGYIVDNPNVGKEMKKMWKMGSTRTFLEFVKLATGEKLSAKAYIENATRNVADTIELAKARIKKLESVPRFSKKVELKAKIKMVHGKKTICTNAKSFEDMVEKYGNWLEKSQRD